MCNYFQSVRICDLLIDLPSYTSAKTKGISLYQISVSYSAALQLCFPFSQDYFVLKFDDGYMISSIHFSLQEIRVTMTDKGESNPTAVGETRL